MPQSHNATQRNVTCSDFERCLNQWLSLWLNQSVNLMGNYSET